MISHETRAEYTATIGIECHVQLKTKTKLFSAVGNDAREAPPNTLVSHIDFGLPGAMPVLNEEAVRLASRMAFALHTRPQVYSYFERKHYFYPDLPMGYQISQLHAPIIVGGEVNISVDETPVKIRINRVQIEADAGKNMHPAGKDYSLVDLNRAATPLLEIVSEPDIHSPAEAKAYVRELYLLVRYADVSDADLYHGNMRFDVNVSISKSGELGTRTETKNLNSFRSVERAAEFEINRQIELLEKGEPVVQETRGWDEAKQKTTSQRGKEEAHDYRYMPDPDLPPITLDEKYISKVESEMPMLPDDYREIFKSIAVDTKVIDDIVSNPQLARLVFDVFNKSNPAHARRVVFWMLGSQIEDADHDRHSELVSESMLHDEPLSETPPGSRNKSGMTPEPLIKLSQMVSDDKLSSTGAKEVFEELRKAGGDPVKIATEKNLLQVSDEGEIAKIIEKVLRENPQAAEDVKNGETKAIGFLVGQVMKESKGKANPQLAQALIKKQLNVN